jgi:hypothetical protein
MIQHLVAHQLPKAGGWGPGGIGKGARPSQSERLRFKSGLQK